MYELPTSILIQGESWTIRNDGDFRIVLDCFAAINDPDLSNAEKIMACMIIFLQDVNSLTDLEKIPDIVEAYKEMVKFFNCGQEEGTSNSHSLIDWEGDSTLIVSAINKVAGKEIRAEKYLHWWTFMSYYVAIGECPLSTIVGIRYKKLKGKKLEKYERQFIADNPQYFIRDNRSQEEKDFEKALREQWNGG